MKCWTKNKYPNLLLCFEAGPPGATGQPAPFPAEVEPRIETEPATDYRESFCHLQIPSSVLEIRIRIRLRTAILLLVDVSKQKCDWPCSTFIKI